MTIVEPNTRHGYNCEEVSIVVMFNGHQQA